MYKCSAHSLDEVKKNYFLTGQLFKPNKVYNGQKLTRLVSKKMPAKARSTMPNVPVITLVKNRAAMMMAIMVRVMRSVLPMFFFIIDNF